MSFCLCLGNCGYFQDWDQAVHVRRQSSRIPGRTQSVGHLISVLRQADARLL
jgi:hypothetical protein